VVLRYDLLMAALDPPDAYPLSDASRAFLAEMREKTAPKADAAPGPMMRVEVAGLDLIVIDASERYEGCPGCAEKDAEIAERDALILHLRRETGDRGDDDL
jgi:hypothetical protein